ncbi:hypothetical protein CXF59_11365 [Flavobacterium sp. ALD4]|uniref:DUF5686 family protein n=1 Tax=Flavobacterium sp. ALD4 TaxID=2058314 RepID=UPI000C340B3B|nr:DUF5686 family protein [Flavobacterium sp. ALD4]PKH66533.1 hypothetical protein CXF59_11365 [Flavobacterium sp. ALD4]
MKHFCILFFFFTLSIQAQFQVNGIVKESTANKPLAFATITSIDGATTISDVDGKFSLSSKNSIPSFEVSYVGYFKTTVPIVKGQNYYTVLLLPKRDDLKEVYISNKKPALAIINKVIENKNKNNPQIKLKTFEFKSYNKLIVSANPDSIKGAIDSVFIEKSIGKTFSKIDSSAYKFKEIINKQHLFQTEKVSQYQFGNQKLKETILGTKMAGFKQPVYEILAFNLQSFSVYDSSYELFETKYNSPIANDAPTDYNYKLLDTIAINGRMSYMIYFKNKKKSKASGLEGVLCIDQNNFAVSKAIMRIKGVLDISGIHEFEYIPQEEIWFPIRKTFKIVKGKNDDDIKILGGTVQFDGDVEKDFQTRKKTPSDITYLLSKTDNFDIQYNTPIKIKQNYISVEIKEDAINKSERFWDSYRKDSLDIRSQKTYLALDSIAIKRRIASRIRFGRKIINGFLPLGFFDMDLRKIISYNNYEGFRLGFGGITNDQFLKNFRIEGYTAYGTKDGNFKYNAGLSTRVGKLSDSWIGVSYTDDVREIASTLYTIEKRPFKLYDPRPINISTFYNYVSWKASLKTQIIPKTESIWTLNRSEIEPKFNYVYNLNNKLYSNYIMTTAMVSLQWNPFSDYMQTPNGRVEVEKGYPKFTFQFTQSLPKVLDNDFEFSKIDFKTEFEKNYLNGQKTNLLFEAGYAIGDIPLTHLYNTSPNNITKESIIQRITFAGKNSFETMFFNEFFSTEFVYFQFKHGFNRVTILKKVKPSLVLVSRMAWGNLQKPEQHVGLDYKTLNEGYFESGIELNQIFKGLGLTAFYRYGPNQLSQFEDNIAVKLSYVLNLGL